MSPGSTALVGHDSSVFFGDAAALISAGDLLGSGQVSLPSAAELLSSSSLSLVVRRGDVQPRQNMTFI